jgi:hypothetical protein
MEDFKDSLAELSSRGLRPELIEAAFLCGSLARGWGNEKSDADIYLILPERWQSETATNISVQLTPTTVPLETIYVNGRQWEVKYWMEDQVSQILDKVSWEQFEDKTEYRLTNTEHGLLARLPSCVPIAGGQWISSVQEKLAESAFQAMIVRDCLAEVEILVEDAVGQFEAHDYESAVLSVRHAHCSAVDALLASHGQLDRTSKWRARRMRQILPPELPFADYWAAETMRDFKPDAPEDWVLAMLRRCGQLKEAVESNNKGRQGRRILV